MPTSPARMPFKAIERSGFLLLDQEVNMAANPPAAAATHVVIKVREVAPGSALKTDPPLKNSFEHIIFRLDWNRWNGKKTKQIMIEDTESFTI